MLYSSEKGSTIAGDLQAFEIAKTIILVVNGKADVTVLFQSDELSPAFREHPELAVMEAVFDRRAADVITGSGGERAGVVLCCPNSGQPFQILRVSSALISTKFYPLLL